MQRRLSVPGGVCYARRCATTGAGAWFMSELGFIIMGQSTEAFGRTSFPEFARVVRTWKLWHNIPLRLCTWQSLLRCLGVCLWCTENWTLPEMTLAVPPCLVRQWIRGLRQHLAFGRISHVVYVAVDSNPAMFGLRSLAEWSRVLSRCFSFSLGCAARTRKSGDPFTSLTWLEVVMM